MGRTVRRVPADWKHPRNGRGHFIPLYPGAFSRPEADPDDPTDPSLCMPDWPAEERTHLMMYEDTSEGTPLSPALETPVDLVRWLVANGASSFGRGEPASPSWWWGLLQYDGIVDATEPPPRTMLSASALAKLTAEEKEALGLE
jgi:hypothetical protein